MVYLMSVSSLRIIPISPFQLPSGPTDPNAWSGGDTNVCVKFILDCHTINMLVISL